MIAGKAACLAVALAVTCPGAHIGSYSPGEAFDHAQAVVLDTFDGPRFGDAAVTLERWHELSGTYEGADISGGHLTLRWAGAGGYCIEGISSTHGLEHVVGPVGRREAGPCP